MSVECFRCHKSYRSILPQGTGWNSEQGAGCCATFSAEMIFVPQADQPLTRVELECGYGSNKDSARYQVLDPSIVQRVTQERLLVRVELLGNLCDECIDQLVAEGKLKPIDSEWDTFDGVS